MADTSLTSLPLAQLQPNPFQPRDQINKEELKDLMTSIKTFGILEPLVVAHTPAGYQIIAGERRWRAAKELGMTDVPVVIKKTNPRGMLEMALVENVQRVDLSPLERAQAFRRLIRDHDFTNTTLSEKIGKSVAFISNTLKLLDLPDAVKDALVREIITEGHARAIAGLAREKDMIECYKIVLKENASVRRTEELARRIRESHVIPGMLRPLRQQVSDETLQKWQDKMKPHFHTKSKLDLIRSHRQTKVTFVFKGSPEETQEDMERIIDLVINAKVE